MGWVALHLAELIGDASKVTGLVQGQWANAMSEMRSRDCAA
jgi:hypothetical protein